ncbi:uncharacterized protein [Apostichopus japonicus]|uniref:uncharacterized protein n=1 Tax=Stichopus japonicus TaxID=307972 RepID=UPI003AB84D17
MKLLLFTWLLVHVVFTLILQLERCVTTRFIKINQIFNLRVMKKVQQNFCCNPFLRNRMAITVDREPLLYPTSIIAALKMLFMSYYVFNICYPTEVQATMEYIQRILFEIDPGRGSRAKKSYRWCINPKVTSLYEWMKESRE